MTVHGAPLAFYLAHVDDETDECILWPYNIGHNGYGQILIEGRPHKVHVLACERHHGPRPDGMWALHTPVICHNKQCFNWRHLSWGTPTDNNGRHRVLDETALRADRGTNAQYTWEQVKEIRARYAAGGTSHRKLAAEYGMTRGNIGHILALRSWEPQ